MIKAILFDMVGVLIFKKENWIPKNKEEINANNIEKLFNHLDDQKLLSDIKNILNLNTKEIQTAIKVIPNKYEKYKDLWKSLPQLNKKFKIAIINNGNSIALKYWKEKFDFKNFNLFLNSAEEGIKKPNPKIFILASKRLGVKVKECLYLDDNLENIESAKKIGMKTMWWKNEQDKNDLLKKFQRIIASP